LREEQKQHERERDLSGSKRFHEELLSRVESKKNGKAGIITAESYLIGVKISTRVRFSKGMKGLPEFIRTFR